VTLNAEAIADKVKERARKYQKDAAAAIEAGEKASALAGQVKGLQDELARFEVRAANLKALGKEPVTTPNPASGYSHQYGCVIEFEPLRSVKSGAELAREMGANIDHIKAEIKARQREIDELLK
jgi:hypothetical protein